MNTRPLCGRQLMANTASYPCRSNSDIIQSCRIHMAGTNEMETVAFIYHQAGDTWVGWLEDSPDYRSQGQTLDELKDNLKDIYHDIVSGIIPCVRRRGELVVG